jgi:hypothetical protein
MRHITISPCFRVVSTFDLPPLQGASLTGQVPGLKPRVETRGLKPWAESYSPFGTKTSRVTSCKCLNCRPRVNPGLCFFGHFGPQIGRSKLLPQKRIICRFRTQNAKVRITGPST